METLSKDILALLSIELNYSDILALCNTNIKNRETCNTYWSEKSVRDFGIHKDDIIGDPLSFYFGLKNNKGYHWYFEDPFWKSDEPKFQITQEDLKITHIQNQDYLDDPNFYIPGIKYPKGEKVFIGYFDMYSKTAEDGITFTMVSKTKERTFQKIIEKIINEYWMDIKEDKIYEKLKNNKLNTVIKDTVNIPMGYDYLPYSHNIRFLIFETNIF